MNMKKCIIFALCFSGTHFCAGNTPVFSFLPELERDKCYNCLIFAFYLHICKKSSIFAAKLD